MASETAPQQGATQSAPVPSAPAPQQMSAEAPARPQGTAPRAPGYAPAFGGVSGAAWVFRDLASI